MTGRQGLEDEEEDTRQMERTLSVNYPVLRQNMGVILNMLEKHHGQKIQYCTSIWHARRDRQIECTEQNLMTVVFTNVFNNPYFGLVQGSSYLVSSQSILYPPFSTGYFGGKNVRKNSGKFFFDFAILYPTNTCLQ